VLVFVVWFVAVSAVQADAGLVGLIGSDDLRVVPASAPTTEARQALPLDVLTASLCKANGMNLVLLSVPQDDLVDWRSGDVDFIDELRILWLSQGRQLFVQDQTIVIAPKLYGSLSAETCRRGERWSSNEFTLLRQSLPSVLESLGAVAGRSVRLGSATMTIVSCGLTAEQLAGLVDAITGCQPHTIARAASDTDAAFWSNLRTQARAGRYDDARTLLVDAIKRARQPSARHFFALFKVEWKLGQKRRAIAALTRVLAIDEHHVEARRFWAELERRGHTRARVAIMGRKDRHAS